MRRVLVFGIDAATLDLLTPWAAAGRLPNFARVMQGGGYAPMQSTAPAMSPPAWTSMITGQNPGKHGIFDFVHLLPGSYRLTTTRRDQTSFRTIFDLATQHGRKVIAMNIPLTYPPTPVNGIMVAGLSAPSKGQYAYPAPLRDELLSWGYTIDPQIEYSTDAEAEYIAEALRTTRVQAEAFKRLLQREPWDLAMMVFRVVDEFQSYLWHHFDPAHPRHDPALAATFGTAIFNSYLLMDQLLGECLELVGPDTTVLIASDHGGGSFTKEVFLNTWLEQQGWLRRRQAPPSARRYAQVMRRLRLTREGLLPKLDRPLLRRLRQAVPQNVQHALFPEQKSTLANTIDWSQTKAYSIGYIGQIFVNLQGREPEGIVAPGAEYEELLDAITAALYQLTDEGQPVVDQVIRSSEVYAGPYAHKGADLNLIMRGMSYISHSGHELGHNEVFAPPLTAESGTHRPVGLFMAYGPDVPAVGARPTIAIVDVAPTILWLLGLPLPNDLDGRLLSEFVSGAALSSQPPEAVDHTTLPAHAPSDGAWEDPEEEAEVLERLKDLGYID